MKFPVNESVDVVSMLFVFISLNVKPEYALFIDGTDCICPETVFCAFIGIAIAAV